MDKIFRYGSVVGGIVLFLIAVLLAYYGFHVPHNDTLYSFSNEGEGLLFLSIIFGLSGGCAFGGLGVSRYPVLSGLFQSGAVILLFYSLKGITGFSSISLFWQYLIIGVCSLIGFIFLLNVWIDIRSTYKRQSGKDLHLENRKAH